MIKMTADDDSCSSYVSVSPTDLTVGTTNTVTDTDADIDTSSCDPDKAFYRGLRMGRAVLWYLLFDLHYEVLCAFNICVNTSMIGPILFVVSIIFIMSRINPRFITQ